MVKIYSRLEESTRSAGYRALWPLRWRVQLMVVPPSQRNARPSTTTAGRKKSNQKINTRMLDPWPNPSVYVTCTTSTTYKTPTAS